MKILLTSLCMLGTINLFAQQHCKIVASETSIPYQKKKANGPNTVSRKVPVKLEYWSDNETGNNKLTVSFTIDPGDAASYNPTLNNDSYTIDGPDFSKKHVTKTIELDISIATTDAFTYGGFKIKIKDGEDVTNVRLEEKDESIDAKTKYDTSKPFWIEMGTNIDLVDGVKPNNFTAGVFFQKFDHRWGGTVKKGRWASFAGAYEAKIVSSVNNLSYRTDTFVNSRSFIPGLPDTVKAFRYAGKPKQTQTIRNWSFFYSPAYRFGGGEYNDNNFHLYLSAWFELRYQEVETKTDNGSLLLIDSFHTPLATLGTFKQSDDTVSKSSAYTHYIGIGFPIYTEGKNFSLFLNPVFGVTNQLTGAQYELLGNDKLSGKTGNSKWNPFYFVQFRLSDNEFGLTVTGEIRGLMRNQSPPQYTIALTKKFNLQKLIYYGKD